jgi:hypothetical protein
MKGTSMGIFDKFKKKTEKEDPIITSLHMVYQNFMGKNIKIKNIVVMALN